MERKAGQRFLSPGFVEKRMMILSIVDNNDHSSVSAKTFLAQLLEESLAALGVKFLFFTCVEQFTVA